MAWVRLDDAMPHHPKVMGAGPVGFALDVAAICYSNKHGTDGYIPEHALPALYPGLPSPKKVAAKLVEVGRWDPTAGGWLIHDYDEFQFSKEEREERDRVKAEKAAKANHKRWHVDRGVTEPSCSYCDSPEESSEDRPGIVRGDAMEIPGDPPTRPDPTPKKTTTATKVAAPDDFEPFWQAYPRRNNLRVGKQDAIKAWVKLSESDRESAMVAVRNYAAVCDRGDTMAKDAHRWLRGRHWEEWMEAPVGPEVSEPWAG